MSARRRRGFTLLEVMMAVAIMAIALGAVFSAQAGSVKMAQRARKLGFASLLSRCKMGEIEEDLAKKGLPATLLSESDECCKDAPIDGFRCKWEVAPIVLPDTMFGAEDDENGEKKGGAKPSANGASAPSGSSDKGKGGLSGLLGAASAALSGKKSGDGKTDTPDKDAKDQSSKDGKDAKDAGKSNALLSGDPGAFLAGTREGGGEDVDSLTAMAMQFVYPVLKPSFQGQIRRATVTVMWTEGSADKTFELTQYVVAEQPVPLATDPNDPNALLGGSTTGTGTGTGQSTVPGTVK